MSAPIQTEEEAQAWRPDIPGWSSDILPYYEEIAAWLRDFSKIVEVGVAHGRSLRFMCERLDELDKVVSIFGVDISPRPAALKDTPAICMQCASARAAERFEDNTLAFVFIDADHSYEGVMADLRAWVPKIASGGIIAGHDYEPAEFDGVVRAVNEFFGGAENVRRPGRTIWEVRFPEHGEMG